jgi:hypothetical protein
VWLLHKASKTKQTLDLDGLLDNIDKSPLEIKLWILFVCLDSGLSSLKMKTILERLISNLNKGDLWKQSIQIAFLAFTSSILKRTNSYLEIPYAILLNREIGFFSKVAHSLCRSMWDLEKERITLEFDESSLRNRFLAILKTRFSSLASAETFRCRGLTDIIVINPEDFSEEIVIECKIWGGKKYYQKGIEQAMGYLTKAEDRVIILVFFRDLKGFLILLDKVKEAIEGAQSYIESSLSEGLNFPNYLFSWHKRKDQNKVGILHIYTTLKR